MSSTHKLFLFISLPILYLVLTQIDTKTLYILTEEDGLIENIGAIGFFLTSATFIYIFYKCKKGQFVFFGKLSQRNIYFGLLGLLFFFAAGEEISWGQRIFGWETPEKITAINAQNETNLHNLWIVQATNPDGSRKSFVELLINPSRLFSMFWLLFCVLVPISYKFSKRAKSFIDYLGLPLTPLWIGGLFLANFFVFNIANSLYAHSESFNRLNEVKETFYALIFFLLAYHFLTYSPMSYKLKSLK